MENNEIQQINDKNTKKGTFIDVYWYIKTYSNFILTKKTNVIE